MLYFHMKTKIIYIAYLQGLSWLTSKELMGFAI